MRIGLIKRHGPVGAVAYLVYRFGNHIVKNEIPKPLKFGLMFTYKILDLLFVKIMASANIPAGIEIGKRVRFFHNANGLIIHPRAIIGDDVVIFQQVTIGAVSDDSPLPVIGNGVIIGAGAKILGDVRIGAGAKIGANAVVVKDIPAGATAVGIPAKVISMPADSVLFE